MEQTQHPLIRPQRLASRGFDLLNNANSNFLRESFLIAVTYVVYSFIRVVAHDRFSQAQATAEDIVALERRLGIFLELDVQQWVLQHHLLMHILNEVYFWGYLPSLSAAAFWLYVWRRSHYLLFRNAFLISGSIALALFALMPTAPPRFMHHLGFIDTMQFSSSFYRGTGPGFLTNNLATFPSMHFAFVLLIGIALTFTSSLLLLKILGVLAPLVMLASIVATGNHYILDAVAGALVASIGLAAALRLRRLRHRAKPLSPPAPLE